MFKSVKSSATNIQKTIMTKRVFLTVFIIVSLMMSITGVSTVNAADTSFKFSFMAISDTHVTSGSTNLTYALQDAVQNNCSAVCVVGDLTNVNGQAAEYDAFMNIMNSNPHPPAYYVVGNHDMWHYPGGYAAASSMFLTKTGMPGMHYDKWINNYHFIFLATDACDNDDAYLSDAQLQWLDSTLAVNASIGKPIFVFLHQPIMNTVSKSFPTNYYSDAVQDQKFADILGKYPQSVLTTGHLHDDITLAGNLYNQQYCTMMRDGAVVTGQGLIFKVYGDRVEVNGRKFSTHTTVWNATIKNYTTDTQAPSAPGGLSTEYVTNNTVKLKWNKSTDNFTNNVGVTGYDVYRGTTKIGSTTGRTSFVATGLTGNTTYGFSVKAKDAAGNISAASSTFNVKTLSKDPIPTNIAKSKTATASSNVSGETPANAVDGSTATKWCATASGDDWLKIDLGANHDISRWVVKHAGAGGEGFNWNTKFFKLQKSSDGTNWTDADTFYANGGPYANVSSVTDRYVSRFTTRYVRLLVTKPTNDDSNNVTRIYEFEVYGIRTPGNATFYGDANYGGTAVTLSPGDYTLSRLQAAGIGNDSISSLKVPSGVIVELYSNDNFGGSLLTKTADDATLVDDSWNDMVSSLKVY